LSEKVRVLQKDSNDVRLAIVHLGGTSSLKRTEKGLGEFALVLSQLVLLRVFQQESIIGQHLRYEFGFHFFFQPGEIQSIGDGGHDVNKFHHSFQSGLKATKVGFRGQVKLATENGRHVIIDAISIRGLRVKGPGTGGGVTRKEGKIAAPRSHARGHISGFDKSINRVVHPRIPTGGFDKERHPFGSSQGNGLKRMRGHQEALRIGGMPNQVHVGNQCPEAFIGVVKVSKEILVLRAFQAGVYLNAQGVGVFFKS